MKRFWTSAEVVPEDSGWAVALDGKPLRTPARQPLLLPSRPLADAIAGEWNSAEETVDPRAMPLTGLSNAAIDRIAPDVEGFAAGLAAYGESDLTCYRAGHPAELAERQCRSWDELLGWARRRFDVDFETTCGVTHVAQPRATIERLRQAIAALDPFRLAGLSPLVTISGSLVAGLAVLEGAFPVEKIWDWVTIDERWQAEQWGADPDAEAALGNRHRDFAAAATFLALLGD